MHAMSAGELLLEANGQLPHGAFGAWLKENFAGSDRTARAYMRVYSHREELGAKRQSSATLSLDGALRALSAPKAESPDPETASLAELQATAEAAYERALSPTYKAAEALREIAGIDDERLAGAIAMLSRSHDEKYVRQVLGFAWEVAFQEYKLSVLTDEEVWRLRTLRAVDEHVRPVDLLPSQGRSVFEDELTFREMHTTFAELIAGGHIVDHTSVAHHIRVMRNLHSEGYTEIAMLYADALLNNQGGTVRPVPEDEYEDEQQPTWPGLLRGPGPYNPPGPCPPSCDLWAARPHSSLCPPRCRKGCLMYTRTMSLPSLYIRNIIPDGMGIPWPSALDNRGGANLSIKRFEQFSIGFPIEG